MDHHWLARAGSVWTARRLNHDYIGTEHILLGLIREGDGVAAQVLVKLGADLNRVRQQVIELISGQQPDRKLPREGAPVAAVQVRLDTIEDRLAAVEQQMGTRADTSDLDGQIDGVRRRTR
jgi:ATP-dependent Clp protease ATP-binding subunit ClpC